MLRIFFFMISLKLVLVSIAYKSLHIRSMHCRPTFFQSVQVKQRRWYMSGMGLLAIWIQWCPCFLKLKIMRLVDTHLVVTKGNEVGQTLKVPRFTLQGQWPFSQPVSWSSLLCLRHRSFLRALHLYPFITEHFVSTFSLVCAYTNKYLHMYVNVMV